jgi:hypothetical protein
MLYTEIIAVCSQIHTKHINTQCGQNVGLLNVNLAIYKIQYVPRSKHTPSRLQNQSVKAVQGNNRCLFSDPHKTHKNLCRQNVQLLNAKHDATQRNHRALEGELPRYQTSRSAVNSVFIVNNIHALSLCQRAIVA